MLINILADFGNYKPDIWYSVLSKVTDALDHLLLDTSGGVLGNHLEGVEGGSSL